MGPFRTMLTRTAVVVVACLLTAGARVKADYVVTAEVKDQMMAGTTATVTVQLDIVDSATKAVRQSGRIKFTQLNEPGAFEVKVDTTDAGALTEDAQLIWFPDSADAVTINRFTVQDTTRKTVCYFYSVKTLLSGRLSTSTSEAIAKKDGYRVDCYKQSDMAELTVYAPSHTTIYYGGTKYWQGTSTGSGSMMTFYLAEWGHGQTLAIRSAPAVGGQSSIQATIRTSHQFDKNYKITDPARHDKSYFMAPYPYGTNVTGELNDYALVTDASWVCENRLYLGKEPSDNWYMNEYNDYFWMPAKSSQQRSTTVMEPNGECASTETYNTNCGKVESIWTYEPEWTKAVNQEVNNKAGKYKPTVAYCRGTMGLQVAEARMKAGGDTTSDEAKLGASKAQAKIAPRCVGADADRANDYMKATTEADKASILAMLSGGAQSSCGKCLKEKAGDARRECLGEYYIYLKGHGFGLIDEELPKVIFRGSISGGPTGGLELASPKVIRLSSRLLKVQIPQAEGTSFNIAFDIIVQRGPMSARTRQNRRRGGQLSPKDTLEVKPEATVCKYCFTYLCECDGLYS